jgi:protease I
MNQQLAGKRIAILATDGFEQSELLQPLQALQDAGATVDVVGLARGQIQGMRHTEKGDRVTVAFAVGEVNAERYSALVLPGGVANPDTLRLDTAAVAFVRQFFENDKPVAAICHGPWTMIEADVVRDRTLTSWPSLRTDLVNAGARWLDRDVVIDGGLVTSRKPDDLPAFCRAMIETFSFVRSNPDLTKALLNPAGSFAEPHDVVKLEGVDDATKVEILRQWESDARALASAEDEGMGGGEESKLEDVRKAVHAIIPPEAADVGTPTKHGG